MAKVLIAEDDPLLSSILASKFQSAGYDVGVALDGEETVQKAGQWIPDIILLDIMMPKKDGFAALEEIKQNPANSSVRVLVLSNVAEQDHKERAQKLGVVQYLVEEILKK
jgi:CheY-like chemotaxis protein